MSDEEDNSRPEVDEGEEEETQTSTYQDLFGASDSEEEANAEEETKVEEETKDEEPEGDKSFLDELEDEADEQEEQRARQEVAELTAQEIGPPLDLTIHDLPRREIPTKNMFLVKLPGIISIEPKRYDQKLFTETEANLEDEYDEEGNLVRKARAAESVIRWREVVDENGDIKRESNARFVRWSDGSIHLMIGTEVLDVTEQGLPGEHHYYCARHPQFLETHGALTRKLTIRPASLNSKLHQKLSVSMAEKAQKITKVKLVNTTEDPEAAKARKEKIEQDRIKANQKLENEQRNRISKLGLDANYLEGEYDDSYNRNSYNRFSRDRYRSDDGFVVDEEEEEGDAEEIEDFRNRHKKKHHRARNEEEDEEKLMKAKETVSSPPERKEKSKKREERKKRKRDRDEEEEEEEEEQEEEESTVAAGEEPDVMIQEGDEPGTTTTTTQPEEVVQILEGEEDDEEEMVAVKKPKRRNVVIDDDDEE